MLPRPSAPRAVALIASVALLAAACARDLDTLAPASFPTEPDVFIDGFVEASFQAFGGSKLDAVTTDPAAARSGTTGLKVTIPGPGNASGGYAGGAIVANVARDLTGYNAVTFWARASITANLDVAGLGNDNSGNSQYPAQWSAIRVTTAWKKYVIPIPWPPSWSRSGGCSSSPRAPRTARGTSSGSTTSGSRRCRASSTPGRRSRRPPLPRRSAPP